VHGSSNSGVGVFGSSSFYGVYGATQGGYGVAGYSASSYGIYGSSNSGSAIRGDSGSRYGVVGVGAKGGIAGFGDHEASVGVLGHSRAGRGGVFGGGLAPMRLLPSATKAHPASGRAGDLFVDQSKRLWFCKGGTIWKQLA
jgi:hypothetical protein